MHPPDPHSTPSWLVPIVTGAVVTFAGLFVLGRVALDTQGPLSVATGCCCVLSFVPFGALPAWVAARRDPLLTAGHGFAVAFIAVGLGALVWAGLEATYGAEIDPEEVRRQMVEQAPPDSTLSEEEIQRVADCVVAAFPYMPAVAASVTTLLAGFVGMMTVGLAKRRDRSVAE